MGGVEIAGCLQERDAKGIDSDTKPGHLIVTRQGGSFDDVAHTLRGEGFDASEDRTGRGTPLVAFSSKDHGADAGELAPTLRSMNFAESHMNGRGQVAVAFDMRGREDGAQMEGPHDTANLRAASGGSSRSYVCSWAVRRLTPKECERLQGFPDGHTEGFSDSTRYRMLGNAVAVPCGAWIFKNLTSTHSLS